MSATTTTISRRVSSGAADTDRDIGHPATDPAGPTGRLATWLATTTLNDVPSSVLERAKYLILDGIAGHALNAAIEFVRPIDDRFGGMRMLREEFRFMLDHPVEA